MKQRLGVKRIHSKDSALSFRVESRREETKLGVQRARVESPRRETPLKLGVALSFRVESQRRVTKLGIHIPQNNDRALFCLVLRLPFLKAIL